MNGRPLPREDMEHVLTHTRGLWEEARGSRIFVTGGTGFFGLWLLETFVHANDQLGLQAQMVVLSRNPRNFAEKAPHLAARKEISVHQGDLRDFAFPEGRFPLMIHAGTTASAPVDPPEMLETIIGGTRRVLDFAAQAGTKKLLLTSSGAVYGQQPSEITHLPEEYAGAPDPLQPSSAYGEGKRVAEHMCAVAAQRGGYEAKIARCFAFVGPHLPLNAHFAVGNFIRDALAGGPIRVHGDGTPERSYLYAADLAIWLWTLLFRGASGRAYNVGSSHALSIAALAEEVKAALETHLPVHVAQKPAGHRTERYVPDIGQAEKELGLKLRVPLRSAIRRTARWHSGVLCPPATEPPPFRGPPNQRKLERPG